MPQAIANAKAPGYAGTRYVLPGETFDVPEGTKKGAWFDWVEPGAPVAAEPPKKAKGKAEVTTLAAAQAELGAAATFA